MTRRAGGHNGPRPAAADLTVEDATRQIKASASGILRTLGMAQVDSEVSRALGLDDRVRYESALAAISAHQQLLDELLHQLAVSAVARGVSQRTVAAAAGVSTNTVTRWVRESGLP